MHRNATLVRKKYMEYLGSTLAFSFSIYLAAIVDGILVGQLIGPESFAAINFTMPVVYMKNIVFMLFINGGSTLAAGFLGERRHDDADRIFTLSISGCVVGYVLLLIFGIFMKQPLSELLSQGGSSFGQVEAYLIPLFASGPLVAVSSGIAAYLRLDGRHALATAIPIVSNVINLCCDYIFIHFFGWGIAGAGWATVTGYLLSLVLLIPYFRDQERNFHFVKVGVKDFSLYPLCLRTGLPMALIQGCNMLRNGAINGVILFLFGDPGGQVISVCNSMLFYGIMFAEGAATAMSSVCGTLFGEKDNRGVLLVLKRAFAVALLFCMCIFVLIELFPVQFGLIYKVTQPATQAMLAKYLRIFALYVPFLAPLYILRSFYQSTKQTNAATAISVLEGAVVTVPIFLLLSVANPEWIWIANCLGAVITLCIVALSMQKKAKSAGADSFLMLPHYKTKEEHEFSIGAHEDNPVKAARETKDFLTKNGVKGKTANALAVACEELCMNISRYAGLKREEQVDVFIRILEEGVLLKIRDSGKPFNPTGFVSDDGEKITGLSLIRALGCAIEYDRIIGFNTTIVSLEH